MWRCVNDIWAYCKGEPEWMERPKVVESKIDSATTITGGTCSKNPKTCGMHFELTNHLREIGIDVEVPTEALPTETFNPDEAGETKVEPKQGSMF